MYKFKYHIDGLILRYNPNNDRPIILSYMDFMKLYPDFPIIQNNFFEYNQDGSFYQIIQGNGYLINDDDLHQYESLIYAINNLGE